MNDRYRRRKNCRLCGSNEIEECFKLKSTPPANAFIEKEKISEEQEHFPLEIFFCKECNHIQILDIVDPKILFENYVYVFSEKHPYHAPTNTFLSGIRISRCSKLYWRHRRRHGWPGSYQQAYFC